jgi:hypothetical protein
MNLQRFTSMKPAEIMFRAGQELAKRMERTGMIGGLRAPSQIDGDYSFNNTEDSHEFRAMNFHSLDEAGFFKGAVSRLTMALLDKRIPGTRAQTIARADDICRGYFNILGFPSIEYGDPIDWHLDPVSGKRAPELHWSRIDALDFKQVGDSKVIWELNRHQWAVTLGQAYRFTGDERYADTFVTYIKGWMLANPPGMGINWASSLEAALRMISWCWALFLFQGSKAISPMMFSEMLEWIRVHMRHIERYLSYYFSPNTHLTGEALALFYVGVLFPELDGAARWRELGQSILLEQLDRQVRADGVYFEQSTCYQRYTVDIYLHYMILAERCGIAVPDSIRQSVQRMIDFLVAVSGLEGSVPQIGDADGGALLPLTQRTPADFRGLFATAAALFNRPDYAWAAGGVTPELFWLLGSDGRKTFDTLSPMPPGNAPTRVFADGGYVVMRSDWEPTAHRLILDVGPLGCNISGGHGHADLLSIQCAAFGQPCLIDPGTYGYTSDEYWREHFRSSMAHNTVTVDGMSQAESAGPFKWHRRPGARLRRWLSTAEFDLADADHDAYHRLPDPVTHRRRVLFSKPRYWMIIDEMVAKLEHRVDLCFQFAASTRLTLESDDWVTVRQKDGSGCYLLVLGATPLQRQQFNGETGLAQGWASSDYGRREPAPALRYSSENKLPMSFITFLVPYHGGNDIPPPIVASSMQNQRLDLVFADVMETIHICDRDIIVERT